MIFCNYLFEAIEEYDIVQLIQYLQEKIEQSKGNQGEFSQNVVDYDFNH